MRVPIILDDAPGNRSFTAFLTEEKQWRIGWIEEVPGVNCKEPTAAELIETLKVTLHEALS